MNITTKQAKVESTYRKQAQITLPTAFQVWTTVAHFHSPVDGKVEVYMRYDHGKDQEPRQITAEEYYDILRKHYVH